MSDTTAEREYLTACCAGGSFTMERPDGFDRDRATLQVLAELREARAEVERLRADLDAAGEARRKARAYDDISAVLAEFDDTSYCMQTIGEIVGRIDATHPAPAPSDAAGPYGAGCTCTRLKDGDVHCAGCPRHDSCAVPVPSDAELPAGWSGNDRVLNYARGGSIVRNKNGDTWLSFAAEDAHTATLVDATGRPKLQAMCAALGILLSEGERVAAVAPDGTILVGAVTDGFTDRDQAARAALERFHARQQPAPAPLDVSAPGGESAKRENAPCPYCFGTGGYRAPDGAKDRCGMCDGSGDAQPGSAEPKRERVTHEQAGEALVTILRAHVDRLERRATAFRELAEAFAEHGGQSEAARLAIDAVIDMTADHSETSGGGDG